MNKKLAQALEARKPLPIEKIDALRQGETHARVRFAIEGDWGHVYASVEKVIESGFLMGASDYSITMSSQIGTRDAAHVRHTLQRGEKAYAMHTNLVAASGSNGMNSEMLMRAAKVFAKAEKLQEKNNRRLIAERMVDMMHAAGVGFCLVERNIKSAGMGYTGSPWEQAPFFIPNARDRAALVEIITLAEEEMFKEVVPLYLRQEAERELLEEAQRSEREEAEH